MATDRNAARNVLLVEDEEINQIVASEMLKQAGFTIEIASSGEEALSLMKNTSFCCVLMDIQMPDMDGFETTQKIREKDADIPIIAMTAFAFDGVKEQCLEAGMNDYITKPINVDELSRKIQLYVS